MSIDIAIAAALNGLVANRVYSDVAPEKTPCPYITYQQAGGDVVNFVEGTIPSQRNARVQVNVWAATRVQATEIANAVEDALRAAPLHAVVIGALTSTYEATPPMRGTRQDFSIWI